jgi:hypothetical protein
MRYPSLLAAIVSVVLLNVIVGAEETGKWLAISGELTSQVKPGYPGKTAGVTVDPATSDVFVVVPDQGLWKSSDQGKTFARVDDKAIGGRCETGWALDFDPAGKRLMCFMIYGSSALTEDSGKKWLASKTSHLDFGAVDWEDTGRAMVARRHESGDMLCYSADQGQSWKDLGKGFTACGIFDAKTLIASKGKGLVRSADAGETWEPVSDVQPAGFTMRAQKGVGYWMTAKGLLASADKGKTWRSHGSTINAVFGPLFGSDAKHLMVVGKDGFHESKDGGEQWKLVCSLPEGFSAGLVGPNYAWDARNDVFYASSMGKDTFKFVRGKE